MNGMTSLMADVAAFHDACNVPIRSECAVVPERVQLRRSILREEWEETDRAMQALDVEGVADGLADEIYVAIGTALEFGIPLDRVWAEVQAANMRKVDATTGKVRRREDGKVLKPEGWTPPDIAAALWGDPTPPPVEIEVGELARLRHALDLCAARFRRYEESHRMKCTSEGDVRAEANREMAEMCEAALSGAVAVLPAEHTRD